MPIKKQTYFLALFGILSGVILSFTLILLDLNEIGLELNIGNIRRIQRSQFLHTFSMYIFPLLFFVTGLLFGKTREYLEELKDRNASIIEVNKKLANAISEKIKSEKRLKQFTSDVSHELRSPIGIMLGETEVTLKRERSKEEYLEILENNFEVLKKLKITIQSLFDLSNYDEETIPLNIERILLTELIDDAKEVSIKRENPNQVKIFNFIDDKTELSGDRGKLLQVFENLISNGIKYSKLKGTIEISSNITEKYLEVTIKDNGIGIKEDHIPHVFDRFYRVDEVRTSEREGSGLGLSICQKIMRAHHGDIKVDSTFGEGTVFKLLFPISSEGLRAD